MPHTTIEAMPPVEYINLPGPELSGHESLLTDCETAYTSGDLQPTSSGPEIISRMADFGAQSPKDELPEPLKAVLKIALEDPQGGRYSRDNLRKPGDKSPSEPPEARTPDAGGSGQGGKPPDAIPSLGGFEEPEEEPEDAQKNWEVARQDAANAYRDGRIDDAQLAKILREIGEPPENPKNPEAPETKTYTAAEAANEIAEIFRQPVKPQEFDSAALSERIREIIVHTPEFNISGMTDVEKARILGELNQRLTGGRPNEITAEIAADLLRRYWPGPNSGTA